MTDLSAASPSSGSALLDTARQGQRVRRGVCARLPTSRGDFTAVGYLDLVTGAEHVAVVNGEPRGEQVLTRVHSECLTGDVFGSLRCDCGTQLDVALAAVADEGGVVVYLGGHEGRGIGRVSKLAAYALQEEGHDTVDANLLLGEPADAREYGAAAAILIDLGARSVRLLTNNPAKVLGLRAHGVDVVERVPLESPAGPHNTAYLRTKRQRLGHQLDALPSDG